VTVIGGRDAFVLKKANGGGQKGTFDAWPLNSRQNPHRREGDIWEEAPLGGILLGYFLSWKGRKKGSELLTGDSRSL